MSDDPRQVAFLTLRDIYRRSAYADVALDKRLDRVQLQGSDRSLATELVYGCVRKQRSLDTLIDRLATKKAEQQPPDLRIILQIGLYQLGYLDRVPDAAAVNTTVDLAKANRLSGLAGFVNGVLRRYSRLRQTETGTLNSSPEFPGNRAQQLGIAYSYPDWIVENWCAQIGFAETEQLCQALDRPPSLHLRVNSLKTTPAEVESAFGERGIAVEPISPFPQSLKLTEGAGDITQFPGFSEGWWTVQDSSAQLATYLLDPQPGETIADACAAPGGKTTHIAELMGDVGTIWACDRTESRLKKVRQNVDRLGLQSVRIHPGDSRNFPQFVGQCDRVLLDAPCSGLGTLHRRADLRWRQTPETARELAILQRELLESAATWVKPGGVLVYATCTLHPPENQAQIQTFLDAHPHWQLDPPGSDSVAGIFTSSQGWIEIWPHRSSMDGFFMARLRRDIRQ
ncbi:MAG: 16S rRNA (cytosine(967)-C(5))-methyltransferase [Geitlerinemataceae cyanobacterium]